MPVATPFLIVNHGRKVVTICPNIRIGATLSGCYSQEAIATLLRKDKTVEFPFHPPVEDGTISPKTFRQAHFQFCKLPRPRPQKRPTKGFSLKKLNKFYQRFIDEGYRIEFNSQCECRKAFFLTYLSDLGQEDDVNVLYDMDEETLQYLLRSALRGVERGGTAFIANFQLEKFESESSVEESECQKQNLQERLAISKAAIPVLRSEIESYLTSIEGSSCEQSNLTNKGGDVGDEIGMAELTSLQREMDETKALLATLRSDMNNLVKSTKREKRQREDLQSRLFSSETSVAKLLSEKESLERSLEEATSQQKDLSDRLANSNAVIIKLISAKKSLQQSMEESTTQRQELEDRLVSSDEIVSNLQSEKESLQWSIKKSTSEKIDLQQLLGCSDALISSLQFEMKTLLKRVNNSEIQQIELKDHLARPDKFIAALQAEKVMLAKSIKNSKSQQHDLEHRLASSRGLVANLKSEKEILVKSIEELKGEQQKQEDRLTNSDKYMRSIEVSCTYRNTLEIRFSSSKECVADLLSEKESLAKLIEESSNQQKELVNPLANSGAFVANLLSEKNSLLRSIAESSNQQHNFDNKLARSDEYVSILQLEKEKLTKSIEISKYKQWDSENRLSKSDAVFANLLSEKKNLLRENGESSNQQRELNDRLAHFDACVANLESEKESSVRSIEELSNQKRELEECLASSDAHLQLEKEKLLKSINQEHELEERLAHSDACVVNLGSERESLLKSIEESSNQQRELNDRLAHFDACVANLESEKESFARSIEELSNQKRELEECLASSDAHLQLEKEKLLKSINQQHELEERLAHSDACVANLQLEKETLLKSIEESSNQERKLNDRLAHFDACVVNLQLEKESFARSIEELSNQKREFNDCLASSNARVASLQLEKEKLLKSIKELSSQQQELENRLTSSDSAASNFQSEKETLVRSLKELENQHEGVVARFAGFGVFAASLQSEKETLVGLLKESTNQLDDLKKRLDISDAVIANLKLEKETMARSIKESTTQQEDLKKCLSTSEAVIADLQCEKETLVKSIEGSKSHEQELKDRLARSIMKYHTAKESQRAAEEKSLNAKQVSGATVTNNRKLQTKLNSANKENTKLKAQIRKLERIDESNKERQLTRERNTVNADNVCQSCISDNLDLDLNGMDAGALRNLLYASLRGERIAGRNRKGENDNLIQDRGFGTNCEIQNQHAKYLRNKLVEHVRGAYHDAVAGHTKSPPSGVPRKNALRGTDHSCCTGCSRSENSSPSSRMGRVSQKSNFEDEESITSGMGSGLSASTQNIDTEEANDSWSIIQPMKRVASKSPSRRGEKGEMSDEPLLVVESAGEAAAAATSGCQGPSKVSANYHVIEDVAKLSKSSVVSVISTRMSSRKRKRLKDAQLLEKDIHILKSSAPTQSDGLEPILQVPSLMQLPKTGYCEWSYDEKSRVLLANFRPLTGKTQIMYEDETYLFRMMERDDISVISEGLADEMNPSLWSREYIEGCIGSEYHHKIRAFETISNENHPGRQSIKHQTEKAGWYSMKVSDYFQYLERRRSVKNSNGKVNNITFSFTDSEGSQKAVNVDKEALYMLDLDVVKLLPQLFEDVKQNFKLPQILPGGSHCMMNAVNANGRPFMGPNLYITPPSSFTQFHQDGHGTVDSGHLCLSGYNEVIMLRRLTEKEKSRALRILTGMSDSHGSLYDFPHRDDLETRLAWPSKEAIRSCEELGFCPSVFILKAGQILHINKGRLHAFRKLAPSTLCKTDCHFDLRKKILQTKQKLTEDICFSIAWDWMYKGVTSNGINKEVSGILECARLNREHNLQSLAIPETCLLFLAKQSIAKYQIETKINATKSLFQMNIPSKPKQGARSEPNAKTVLCGILPSLTSIVRSHKSAAKRSERIRYGKRSSKISIDSHPNTWKNPVTSVVDPYGAEDFSCKICGEELSNVYMHCDGCEKLLNKDYNICCTCLKEGKYNTFHQVNPFTKNQNSMLNHTGNMEGEQKSNCCGQPCTICSYCTGCSCKCHQCFTLHFRFMNLQDEAELLENAKSIVCPAKKIHLNI